MEKVQIQMLTVVEYTVEKSYKFIENANVVYH